MKLDSFFFIHEVGVRRGRQIDSAPGKTTFKKPDLIMIKLGDFYLDNILIDEKSHGNALIYDTSCNALIGSKPLGTRLDKIDGVIRIYNGTRYLTLFSTEKLVAVYDKIRSLRTLKTSMIFIFSYYFAKIKTGSYGSLSIEKKSLT